LHIGLSDVFTTEVQGVVKALKIALDRGWSSLWLESDSSLVVASFQQPLLVPWRLRNQWEYCLLRIRNMQFKVTHIYHEGNACADKLANFGVHHQNFTWWEVVPNFIREDYVRNGMCLPMYRYT